MDEPIETPPTTKREKEALLREQRLLWNRLRVGTISPEDRERMQVLRVLLRELTEV